MLPNNDQPQNDNRIQTKRFNIRLMRPLTLPNQHLAPFVALRQCMSPIDEQEHMQTWYNVIHSSASFSSFSVYLILVAR